MANLLKNYGTLWASPWKLWYAMANLLKNCRILSKIFLKNLVPCDQSFKKIVETCCQPFKNGSTLWETFLK